MRIRKISAPGCAAVCRARRGRDGSACVDAATARQICGEWALAPRAGEIARSFTRTPGGCLVTALHTEGEVVLSCWEPATWAGREPAYRILDAPFDFEDGGRGIAPRAEPRPANVSGCY